MAQKGYAMINQKTGKRKLLKEPKMQRTQILLDPIQHKQLADLAEQENGDIRLTRLQNIIIANIKKERVFHEISSIPSWICRLLRF